MDNFLSIYRYTQHDLLWMKSTSQLLSRSVSLTDLLMMAFSIMMKDPLLIISNKQACLKKQGTW